MKKFKTICRKSTLRLKLLITMIRKNKLMGVTIAVKEAKNRMKTKAAVN